VAGSREVAPLAGQRQGQAGAFAGFEDLVVEVGVDEVVVVVEQRPFVDLDVEPVEGVALQAGLGGMGCGGDAADGVLQVCDAGVDQAVVGRGRSGGGPAWRAAWAAASARSFSCFICSISTWRTPREQR
jgi:hypothetical protein